MAEENFTRPFTGNWILENITINGSGNSEILVMGQPGYGISEIWRTSAGLFNIFQNKYGVSIPSNYLEIQYRTATTREEIIQIGWSDLIGRNIESLGYVQLKVNITPSSSSSSRSSSSSSSSSSCRSSSSSSMSSSSSSSCRSSSSSSSSYAVFFTFDEQRPENLDEGKSWRARISTDGNVAIATDTYKLFLSTDGGSNWVEKIIVTPGTLILWNTVAVDSDGSNLMVASWYFNDWSGGVYGERVGRVYTSSDGGSNWVERRPLGVYNVQWGASASNSTGSFLLMMNTGASGGFYKSSNSGVDWQLINPSGHGTYWQGVNCDQDGSHIIAVTGNTEQVWISTDFGVSWNNRTPPNYSNSDYCASNETGSLMVVAPRNSNSVFITTDYGVSWIKKQIVPSGVAQFGEIVISGSTIILSIRGIDGYSVYGYDQQISMDNGITFTALANAFRMSSFTNNNSLIKIIGWMSKNSYNYSEYGYRLYIGRRGI